MATKTTRKSHSPVRWEQLNRDVIAATDIEAAYRELGVEIASERPSASGWLSCHAVGREDRNPSAAINVGDGLQRGRYKDLGGTGESFGLFDFAAKYGTFSNWEEARVEYGKRAGLLKKFPKDVQDRPENKVGLRDSWNRIPIRGLLNAYPGITEESIRLCGGRLGYYPKSSTQPRTVVAWPTYGPGGVSASEIRGYVIQAADGGKVDLYKGPGNPTEAVKRATIGNSGLVGLHGLNNLDNAELIWKVEGISDLLAVQGIIPIELREKHVVVTNAGGTHEHHLLQEVSPLFMGKTVAVLHDCDVPGQQGAGAWVGQLKPLVKSIKNIVMPFDQTAAKGKDVRDWIVAGGTYPQLLEMYGTAEERSDDLPSVETTDSIGSQEQQSENSSASVSTAEEFAGLTPEQQCLKKLGIVVLGEIEGTKTIVCFAQKLAKMVEIKQISRYKVEDFAQDFGDFALKQWIELGEGAPNPNKYTMAQVRIIIAIEGGKRRITSQNQLGVGVWELNGRLVIVNAGELAILNGHLEKSSIPSIEGKLIDFGNSDPWFSYAELDSLFEQSEDQAWCQAVFDEAAELFGRWDNWLADDSPQLMTALVCCSWLQTVWEWRPQIAVCGPTNSGKTMLFTKTLKHIFGKLCLLSSRPSEAGIRQNIGHTAKIVMIDEFEHDNHREKILELFRTSSRGSETLRGTAGSQQGVKFGLKHIPWVASIEIGAKRAPDRNRYIILELGAVPENKGSTLVIPEPEELRAMGMRLLVVAMRQWKRTKEISSSVIQRNFRGVDRRIVESYALPCAMLSAVLGLDVDTTESMMNSMFSKRDLGEQGESDEAMLLQEIYESVVLMPHGLAATVSEMLSTSFIEPGWQDALVRSGIKPYEDSFGNRRIFFVRSSMKKSLLRNSDFCNQDINQILVRVRGAQRDKQRMGGHFPRGVSVPEDQIHKLFGEGLQKSETTANVDSI